MKFELRQGLISDGEWLYQLYRLTMRSYIEETWGWDEAFHINGFKTNLHPTKFKIVIVEGINVGAYIINNEPDHYWLEMIFISPKVQKHGLGSSIINNLQKESKKNGKPLKLSVLRVNPAKEFYSRFGFHVYDKNEDTFKMVWP